MNMRYEYYLALLFIIASAFFCVELPLYAGHNYVRQMDYDSAWYIEKSRAETTGNDDAEETRNKTIPSVIIIYATFVHYLLIAIFLPKKNHNGILPILNARHEPFHILGKYLSYICVSTIPVLMPILIFYLYHTGTIETESFIIHNARSRMWVYALPALLYCTAIFVVFLYACYVFNKIFQALFKKSFGDLFFQ